MLKRNSGKKKTIPTVSFKVWKFSTMFQWCGGLGVRLTSEGSLVQYALWGDYILLFLSATQFWSRGCTGSNLPEGKYWPFLPVTHSSIFLRNCWRNSSSVTLRYTSRFICVVRNLFRKRRHTFRTVLGIVISAWCMQLYSRVHKSLTQILFASFVRAVCLSEHRKRALLLRQPVIKLWVTSID
jgi:hypothetical protein